MTFNSEINSTTPDLFLEFYEILSGGVTYRFVNNTETKSYDGFSWAPALIERGEVKEDVSISDSQDMEISAYVEEPFVDLLQKISVEKIEIKIFQVFIGSSSVNKIFNGVVYSANEKDQIISLKALSNSNINSKEWPRYKIQSTCNHTLFSTQCTLLKTNFETVTAVTVSGDGKTITSSAFGIESDDYFTGGELVHSNESRLIISHVGNDIVVASPFASLSSGTSIKAYPSCFGRFTEDCTTKFSNTENFVGFPDIAESNIFIWGLQ